MMMMASPPFPKFKRTTKCYIGIVRHQCPEMAQGGPRPPWSHRTIVITTLWQAFLPVVEQKRLHISLRSYLVRTARHVCTATHSLKRVATAPLRRPNSLFSTHPEPFCSEPHLHVYKGAAYICMMMQFFIDALLFLAVARKHNMCKE